MWCLAVSFYHANGLGVWALYFNFSVFFFFPTELRFYRLSMVSWVVVEDAGLADAPVWHVVCPFKTVLNFSAVVTQAVKEPKQSIAKWVLITLPSNTRDLVTEPLQSPTTSTWSCWSSCTPSWLVCLQSTRFEKKEKEKGFSHWYLQRLRF